MHFVWQFAIRVHCVLAAFRQRVGGVQRVAGEGPSNVSTRTSIQIQIRMRIGNRTCAFEFGFFTL